jgi:hypothetical protein
LGIFGVQATAAAPAAPAAIAFNVSRRVTRLINDA